MVLLMLAAAAAAAAAVEDIFFRNKLTHFRNSSLSQIPVFWVIPKNNFFPLFLLLQTTQCTFQCATTFSSVEHLISYYTEFNLFIEN
jgi:hypothetical protein